MATSKAQRHALEALVVGEFTALKDDDSHIMAVGSYRPKWGDNTNQTLQALVKRELITIDKEVIDRDGNYFETTHYRLTLTVAGRKIGIDQMQLFAHDDMEADIKRTAVKSHDRVMAVNILEALRVQMPESAYPLLMVEPHNYRPGLWIVTGFSDYVTVKFEVIKSWRDHAASLVVETRGTDTSYNGVTGTEAVSQWGSDLLQASNIMHIIEGLSETILATG